MDLLLRLGGVASRRQLLEVLTPGQLRSAVSEGRVSRVGHGLYALPEVDDARAAARSLCGVLSHTSAALHHGWPVKSPPRRPHVMVPRKRRVAPGRKAGVHLHYGEAAECADGLATSPEQTVVDCARVLPFDEALAVADSALRAGVGRHSLLAAAERSSRTGRTRAIRVVEAGDGRAENPFESVVRALSLELPALRLVPQVVIPGYGRPDLYDEASRLVVECDSFTFHARREAVVKDVERYNAAQLHQLALLRFAWEHIMLRQDYVRQTFRSWLVTDGQAVRADGPR